MSVSSLAAQVKSEANAIATIYKTWFVKKQQRVAAARLIDYAERLVNMNTKLEQDAEKKARDYSKINEWREAVEQTKKDANAARTQMGKLERRITTLEREVADAQSATDEIKDQTRKKTDFLEQEIVNLKLVRDDLQKKLQDESVLHQNTEDERLKEIKALRSMLQELQTKHAAVFEENCKNKKALENAEASNSLLQERLDAIDLHAVAIHGIVAEKPMAGRTEGPDEPQVGKLEW